MSVCIFIERYDCVYRPTGKVINYILINFTAQIDTVIVSPQPISIPRTKTSIVKVYIYTNTNKLLSCVCLTLAFIT